MIDCPIYWIDPNAESVTEPPPEDPIVCNTAACYCGYVQYESLVPYLADIKYLAKKDVEEGIQLEFKLREQIIEISRLFDIECGVEPGHFSPAHYTTTKVFSSNGTRYLKIPDFVKGTLEVRTNNNVVLDESSYAYKDGFLFYLPCVKHESCGCPYSCGEAKRINPMNWPNACYKVTARWGKQCADAAVQKAIRDYLIEGFRVQDPVDAIVQGILVSRTFKAPHSWNAYVSNFKQKRKIYSQWAIA